MLSLFIIYESLSCVFAICTLKRLRTRYLRDVREGLRYLCLGKKGVEDRSNLNLSWIRQWLGSVSGHGEHWNWQGVESLVNEHLFPSCLEVMTTILSPCEQKQARGELS